MLLNPPTVSWYQRLSKVLNAIRDEFRQDKLSLGDEPSA
jgi:hypothetical protein